jgi:hypothetical protein
MHWTDTSLAEQPCSFDRYAYPVWLIGEPVDHPLSKLSGIAKRATIQSRSRHPWIADHKNKFQVCRKASTQCSTMDDPFLNSRRVKHS